MRTWTASMPPAPDGSRTFTFSADVMAFDEAEAAPLLLAKLGFTVRPCCELDADPCAACASEDQARREDEGAEREAYRERQDPDVLRAQDADRGGGR